MDLLRQDDVYQAVMVLWPRSRLTKDEFAVTGWPGLRNYGEEYVKAGLKRHRAKNKNATRPDWDALAMELASDGGDGSGRNDFEVLIVQLRKHLESLRVKHLDQWSDADVFQNHLDANPANAKGIVFGWRSYFVERGETLPGFLEDER